VERSFSDRLLNYFFKEEVDHAGNLLVSWQFYSFWYWPFRFRHLRRLLRQERRRPVLAPAAPGQLLELGRQPG
jgi:hypothetical protein